MTFTKERLQEIVEDGFLKHGESKELARMALAALTAEKVILYREVNPYNGMTTGWMELTEQKYEFVKDNASANAEFLTRYTAQPAPVVPDALYQFAEFMAAESIKSGDYPDGWQCKASNAAHEYAQSCRAAMLQGAEPASNCDELPLDYLQGHKDGLEWAAQLAKANHPETGDWLYDDPIELSKAIRKGPDMPLSDGNSPVIQDGWIKCSERMPEDEQEVLTRNRMGHCFVSFFDEHSGLFFDRVDVAAACCIEHILVTHWMPLPAAPQQEE